MLSLHSHLLGNFQILFSWTRLQTPCPTIQNALPSKWFSAFLEPDSRLVPFSKAQQKLPTIPIETYRRYTLRLWLTKIGGIELAGQRWELSISHTDTGCMSWTYKCRSAGIRTSLSTVTEILYGHPLSHHLVLPGRAMRVISPWLEIKIRMIMSTSIVNRRHRKWSISWLHDHMHEERRFQRLSTKKHMKICLTSCVPSRFDDAMAVFCGLCHQRPSFSFSPTSFAVQDASLTEDVDHAQTMS